MEFAAEVLCNVMFKQMFMSTEETFSLHDSRSLGYLHYWLIRT